MAVRGADALAFPDVLAKQAAQLCQRLAHEREVEHANSHAEISKERDALRAEVMRLKSELKVLRRAGADSSIRHTATEVGPEETEPVSPSHPTEPATRGLTTHWPITLLPSATLLPTINARQSSMSRRSSRRFSAELSYDSGTADQYMLRKAFRDMDQRKLNRVCAEDFLVKMKSTKHRGLSEENLQNAFIAVNFARETRPVPAQGECTTPRRETSVTSSWTRSCCSDETECPDEELNFEGFRVMILRQDIEELVGTEVMPTICEVRDFYVRWATEQAIVERMRVQKESLGTEIKESTLPGWLEPSIGIVICLNACTIGISQDHAVDSVAWDVIEIACAAFFILEVVIKVYCVGFVQHFFGMAWTWNWFDFGIVIIAVMDVCFMLLPTWNVQDLPQLGAITIVRLVRLLRMARIVRLVRVKFFKELTLMVNGVLTGLKTLCWAFVFLLVLVYILGVLMKQLLDVRSFPCSTESDAAAALPQGGTGECSRSEEVLLEHNQMLFSSVFRAMLTVFRCLIGDCSAPDGVPLAPHLMDALGVAFTLGYLVVTCFVLFGVFNLVMAIFVENTLEAARVSQQKRHEARATQDIRVAQELRNIVLRICTKPADSMTTSVSYRMTRRVSRAPFVKQMRHCFSTSCDEPADELQLDEDMMQLKVSREVFEEVMADPKVIQILEDLEIPVTDHAKLFDIIDSNGSGQLDILEIIEGLMKLRGPADKGDIVCSALMVRSVQRELRRLELDMLARHSASEHTQNRILAALMAAQHPLPEAPAHRKGTLTAI